MKKDTPKPTVTDHSGSTMKLDESGLTAARNNLKDGAMTPAYGPWRDDIVNLLNDALATELVCVLRYKRHYFMASGVHAEAVAAEFLQHAQEEQEHADQLATRIVQLGGEPDLDPDTLSKRSHAEYKVGKDLRDMVKEDLIAERIAIDSYRELIAYVGDKDSTTRRLLEGILEQEEEHADEFADLLDGWIGE